MVKIENIALTDLVYEKIKYMIDTGVLGAGKKINKIELVGMLGVSQTPINDALNRLSGEKFIEQKRRGGFFVREYSYFELSQLFEIRAAMEGMAVRLCVEKNTTSELDQLVHAFDGFSLPMPEERFTEYFQADKIFHENIVKFAGNPFLLDLANTSGYLIKSNQRGLVRAPDETLSEHRLVMDAIAGRDAMKAQEHLIKHLMNSRDKLRSAPN
jgi:DNA-binding GntR family transcriptional regulator